MAHMPGRHALKVFFRSVGRFRLSAAAIRRIKKEKIDDVDIVFSGIYAKKKKFLCMSDYLASYRLHGERIFRRIPALDMAGIGMLKLPGNNYYNFVTRKRFVKLISCAKEGVCVIKLH